MGSVPSRETHRRGIFSVQQQFPQSTEKPSTTSASGSGAAAAAASSSAAFSRKQEIVLIPLTKEFFPSPDCPLFIQFHKARCDAAVNYYFRRPGNPGDLSSIPNYASSYRLPGEEEALQQRLHERAVRRRERAAAREAAKQKYGEGLFDEAHDENGNEAHQSRASGSDQPGEDDDDDDDDESEDESFPSRDALYRGVVERVEEALFDTDAEMTEAFRWARAHPHTTMGPNGQKQRKVLPVLCAVAFRYDPNKIAATGVGGVNTPLSPTTSSAHAAAASVQHQAAVENGVYMFGSIINIVGCFGFVSMEEEVEALKRELELQNNANDTTSTAAGARNGGGMEVMQLSSPQTPTPGRTYKHDPYSFTSSQDSSVTNSLQDSLRGGGSLLVSRASLGGGGTSGRRTAARDSIHAMMGTRPGNTAAAVADPNSPPPVAAPLAAMVFLTKSAGEQNLGRVTHIAATTYYFQLIQAGVIPRQAVHAPPGATVPPPPPYYGLGTAYGEGGALPASSQTPIAPNLPSASPTTAALGSIHHPQANLPLPPMETFSFSSLITNIPILSFVYEMKCRWGYLGVFRGTPTSANSSFTDLAAAGTSQSAEPAANTVNSPTTSNTNATDSFAANTAHRRALLMGTHSSGGLTGVDRTVGQNMTDEIEMWVTADQMLHGRISKDLAERLCWALAERPDVMHERVLQLPSEEAGYWRYRGLVDSTRPPPLPVAGAETSAPAIHPRDVYVMGSDVLPGFNEGDILRFDPDRLVWFSDPSIPLEGVVLAAMRPYCKMAREASSDNAGWVTKIESREKLDYDMRREERENPALFHFLEAECFPLPPPSQDQEATLRTDSKLTRVHEHVGNFFVYRFERDGTEYYHGTVPNFANPNKKRAAASAASASAANAASAGSPHTQTSATGHHGSSHTAASPTAAAAHTAHQASPAPSCASAKTTSASAVHNSSNSTAPTTNAASATGTSSGAGLEVPKSIASALFSLAQPTSSVSAHTAARASAAAPSHATTATTTTAAEDAAPAATTAATTDGTPATTEERDAAEASAGTAGTSATGSSHAQTTTSQKPSPYLTGRVTSGTVMQAARRWMESLYSYAYGVPKPNTAASNGAAGGQQSRGQTPSHGAGVSPAPPPLSPVTPMARQGSSAGASWSTYPATASSAPKLGSPVSTGLSTGGGGGGGSGGSYPVQGWGAGRSDEASAVWPRYNTKMSPAAGGGTGSRAASPFTGTMNPSPYARCGPGAGMTGAYAAPYMTSPNGSGQTGPFPQTSQGYGSPYTPLSPSHAVNTQDTTSSASGGAYYTPSPQLSMSMSMPMPAQRSNAAGQPTRHYTIGEDGNYVWFWS